jgi:hypothetical protein
MKIRTIRFHANGQTGCALLGLILCTICFRGLGAEPFPIQGDLTRYRFEPNQVYLVEKDIEVPQDKTVELPAGTVFLFLDDKRLVIGGDFSALGNDSAPVVFSSVNDPGYTQNHDSSIVTPFSWAGIKISETSSKVTLRNAVIKYADAPLTCQTPNIALQNVKRVNTKLDGFLLNDKKYSFKQNQAFNFPFPAPEIAVASTESKAPKPAAPLPSNPTPKKPLYKKSAFRYSLGGAGGIALCTGIVFFIDAIHKNGQSKEQMDRASNRDLDFTTVRTPALQAAKDYDNQRKKSLTNGVITAVIGALFLGGLGITFSF